MSNQALITSFGIRAELPQFFDNQVTGNFSECERRVLYATLWARRWIGRDDTALSWGKVFHKGTEILKTTQDVDYLNTYIHENLDENLDDRYGRTRGRMFEALVTWLEWRRLHPIKTIRTEQATIVKCDKPCIYYPDKPDGCGLIYGGIQDEIVDWQGYIGPLDYKTTVMTDSDPMETYRMDHQMMGYNWIASHLLGRHCWGVIVERIITNKSKIDIARFPIPYSKDQIRQWVRNEIHLQARLKKLAAEHPYDEEFWTQNYKACDNPYKCAYKEICIAPTDMNFRYKHLRDRTREERWDFTNRDKENG